MNRLIGLVIFVSIFSSCQQKKHVDLIIKNAKIYLVNEHFDTSNVLIINKGKLVAIGNKNLLKQYSSETIKNLQGQFIYPGFIDAHCHFTGYAMDKQKLKLFGTKSFNAVVQKIIEYSKSNKHQWIEGSGWDQNTWTIKQFPTKDTLDKLFPNTPIALMRIDGHAFLCNQKALDLAHITKNTKLFGGIVETKNGKLTGLLFDNAMNFIKDIIPLQSQEEVTNNFIEAEHNCFEVGLTSVVDCGVKKYVLDWLNKAQLNKKVQIKTCIFLTTDSENLNAFLNEKIYRSECMHIAGFKVYVDGALGSRGALLKQAYNDQHNYNGVLLLPLDSLKKMAKLIYKSPYQFIAHAIGDSSNKEVLEIFASQLKGKNDRRWRIEHAQVVSTNDLHLFGENSIIPSVQPTHATSDQSWALSRIGTNRMPEAYAYKKLLQQNNYIALGTDFPVEYLNPLYTFSAAVFRTNQSTLAQQGFQMENALTREEALRGMTIWAAKSVFEDGEKGSLEIGKSADITILDVDLMKASAQQIFNAKILATYVNGKEVYSLK